MKKSSKKSQKIFRKSIVTEINNMLVAQTLGIAESFDFESKKATKLIIKTSKKLAKHLAKHLKTQKSSADVNVDSNSSDSDASTVEKATSLPETSSQERL